MRSSHSAQRHWYVGPSSMQKNTTALGCCCCCRRSSFLFQKEVPHIHSRSRGTHLTLTSIKHGLLELRYHTIMDSGVILEQNPFWLFIFEAGRQVIRIHLPCIVSDGDEIPFTASTSIFDGLRETCCNTWSIQCYISNKWCDKKCMYVAE